jgi:ribosomal protein L14
VDAAGDEERSGARVVKLVPVVTLDSLHRSSKLYGGVGDESGKCAESVRFETQRKNPQVMSAVIKNNQIIFIT